LIRLQLVVEGEAAVAPEAADPQGLLRLGKTLGDPGEAQVQPTHAHRDLELAHLAELHDLLAEALRLGRRAARADRVEEDELVTLLVNQAAAGRGPVAFLDEPL